MQLQLELSTHQHTLNIYIISLYHIVLYLEEVEATLPRPIAHHEATILIHGHSIKDWQTAYNILVLMTRFANTSLHSMSTPSEPHPLLGTAELAASSHEFGLTDMFFLVGLPRTVALQSGNELPEIEQMLRFWG